MHSGDLDARCSLKAPGDALLLDWASQEGFGTNFSEFGVLQGNAAFWGSRENTASQCKRALVQCIWIYFFSLKFSSFDSWELVEFVWHHVPQIGSYFDRSLGQNKG